MPNQPTGRRSVALAGVCLGVGLAAGALGAGPTSAQTDPPVFAVGSTITLAYEGRGGKKCVVEAVRGQFVKCKGEKRSEWWNLNVVLLVETEP